MHRSAGGPATATCAGGIARQAAPVSTSVPTTRSTRDTGAALMADKSAIEWTEASWNPIGGCSVISPGCQRCYAMRLAGGRLRSSPKYRGLTEPSKVGPVWNGDMRLWEKALDQPLRWKKPRRIFVNSMSDLFHESLPDEWIDRVFGVMALCPQHRFQVLTKRAERMRRYLEIRPGNDLGARWAYAAAKTLGPGKDIGPCPGFPLPNVWLGVSVEDQERDGRIRELLAPPAAVRWVSLEPLLGPVDLAVPLGGVCGVRLDWVVLGGESGGRDARPMNPDWARSVRDQCVCAGVPFFFKQWGGWLPRDQLAWRDPTERYDGCEYTASHVRVGKKAAGRLLDGVTWDEYPTV